MGMNLASNLNYDLRLACWSDNHSSLYVADRHLIVADLVNFVNYFALHLHGYAVAARLSRPVGSDVHHLTQRIRTSYSRCQQQSRHYH